MYALLILRLIAEAVSYFFRCCPLAQTVPTQKKEK